MSFEDNFKIMCGEPANQKMYVLAFGFEIEGGFNEDPEDSPDNEYLKYDGSVCGTAGYAGEIASPIFRVPEDWSRFLLFSNANMPIDVNESAGIHIHISLNNNMAYQKCMDLKFWNKFKIELAKLFRNGEFSYETKKAFESRFFGGNRYCERVFSPNSQALERYSYVNELHANNGDRYTMLNYPYEEHGTIECRAFPSTVRHDELIKMVSWFIGFTNKYLSKCSNYEHSNKSDITIEEEDSSQEDYILCV